MSTPFKNPYSARITLQDLLDELTLAYSERRQAISQPAYTPLDGRDVQAVDYWRGLQWWVDVFCHHYVDHLNGPTNEEGTDLLYFTTETFRAAAGLHPDGFRRAAVWDGRTEPDWQYGVMRAGDIIGPWVVEDLQNCFSALKWARYSPEKCGLYSFPSGHPHRAYKPYPGHYPDDSPHRDNPWVPTMLNGLPRPVEVWVFPFNMVDDYCVINGVMVSPDKYSCILVNTPRCLFSLDPVASNEDPDSVEAVTIEVFDTQGKEIGFAGGVLAG